jgi:uroporphyrinogen-III synthase
MQNSLKQQTILVTRPAHKQAELMAMLEAQGAETATLATIEIAPIAEQEPEYARLKQHILDLDLFDIIICVSANAARMAGELIDQYWPQLPVQLKFFAIGQATQAALADYDICSATATKGTDSEALLKEIDLQQLQNSKVLILKGTSGRELLSDTLQSRGAQVFEANLYNRLIPVYTDQQIKNTLYNSRLSAILISSGEALCNLMTIAKGSQNQFDTKLLLATQVIVPSTRVAQIASTQGYQSIKVAASADDESMMQALLSVIGLEADNEEKN